MSRFVPFRRLTRHLNSYLRRSNNKLDSPSAIPSSPKLGLPVPHAGKFAVLIQTLRAVIMNDQTESATSLNVEEQLQQALENGDAALLNLMEQLKDFVIVVSEEYRNCLARQMEVMERASSAGPLSEAWDELPQYRTLADELDKELNDYLAVFNTLGRMAGEKTLIEFVSGASQDLDLVAVKYNELDALLKREIAKNKTMQLEFLRFKRDIILKEVST